MSKIDMDRVYRTRDGREVRIYAVDGMEGGIRSIHGAFKSSWGWLSRTWNVDGSCSSMTDNALDLIEVKPRIKRKVWVNVYRGRESDWMTIHDERDVADDYPDSHEQRIACVEIDIDVEEGHGL